jgi:hypothetical protein
MLLDIPAVADTAGVADSLTWNATGIYNITAGVSAAIIPGRFISGTFTDNEEVIQQFTTVSADIRGAGQTAAAGLQYLIVDGAGGTPDATHNWVGDSSAAIFQPSGKPFLPPWVFVYVDAPNQHPYIVRSGDISYELPNIRLRKNPRQGSTLKVLTCVTPTFTIPEHCSSWSLKNISGAVAYFRRFAPNVEANVIDTVAKTFGEASIVGTELVDEQVVAFSGEACTPGTSFIMCATAAAADGAIVDFYP